MEIKINNSSRFSVPISLGVEALALGLALFAIGGTAGARTSGAKLQRPGAMRHVWRLLWTIT